MADTNKIHVRHGQDDFSAEGSADVLQAAYQEFQKVLTARARKVDSFSLAEGPVTLEWPARISPQSAADLIEWLNIVIRKIERAGETPKESPCST